MWNAHNAVFGSRRSAICAQAVYFLHSTKPSVTWLSSRWWLAACDVMSASSAVLSTPVGLRKKFREVSCTECTFQENDYELIPTVKMKTKNPVQGYFGTEFPTICNHCEVSVAWSLKTLDLFWEFCCFFLKNDPFTEKFSKFCFKSFHGDTDRRVVLKFRVVLRFRKIWPTGNLWST